MLPIREQCISQKFVKYNYYIAGLLGNGKWQTFIRSTECAPEELWGQGLFGRCPKAME